MPAPQTPFNRAWDAALRDVKERMGASQQAVADAIGVSRGAVQGARTLPKAISYGTVNSFCEQFELDDHARHALRWAWLEERITFGAIGAAVRDLVDYAAKRFDAEEFERVCRGMVAEFESAMTDEDR